MEAISVGDAFVAWIWSTRLDTASLTGLLLWLVITKVASVLSPVTAILLARLLPWEGSAEFVDMA